jgi:secretion/DNA translocation related TadE-like protein
VSGDGGAGSVLGVAVIGAIVTLSIALVPLGAVLARTHAIAGAADAAALAAADARSGAVPGSPCIVAATVASSNGAALTACELDGLIATVRVGGSVFGLDVVASATAGPPD